MTRWELDEVERQLALRQTVLDTLHEAERIAAAITDPYQKASALTRIARVWLKN